MNDIDIEEGRRLDQLLTDAWDYAHRMCQGHEAMYINALVARIRQLRTDRDDLRNNAAAMFDAIETGRQWETIARRLLSGEISLEFALAAFREPRRPDPHPDGRWVMGECEHEWLEGVIEEVRQGLRAGRGWQGYEYCAHCHAFREAPR